MYLLLLPVKFQVNDRPGRESSNSPIATKFRFSFKLQRKIVCEPEEPKLQQQTARRSRKRSEPKAISTTTPVLRPDFCGTVKQSHGNYIYSWKSRQTFKRSHRNHTSHPSGSDMKHRRGSNTFYALTRMYRYATSPCFNRMKLYTQWLWEANNGPFSNGGKKERRIMQPRIPGLPLKAPVRSHSIGHKLLERVQDKRPPK